MATVRISAHTCAPSALSIGHPFAPASSRAEAGSLFAVRHLTLLCSGGSEGLVAALQLYVVRQGDYLAKIADSLGFDPDEAWNHPRNSELKELRKDPHVLLPGDILWFNKITRPSSRLAGGTENAYVAEVPRVPLHIQIRNHVGEPFAGEAYEAEAGADVAPGNLTPEAAELLNRRFGR
jgi:hypothetical protein